MNLSGASEVSLRFSGRSWGSSVAHALTQVAAIGVEEVCVQGVLDPGGLHELAAGLAEGLHERYENEAALIPVAEDAIIGAR